jgi:hypothetical protein
MPPAHQLHLVQLAIRSGIFGFIQWKDSAALLVQNDPAMAGLTPSGIRALLRQFVEDGNTLDVRLETRVEYLQDNPEDPYWYRAIIPVPDFPNGLFIEVRLIDADPIGPWVEIVSAHEQLC